MAIQTSLGSSFQRYQFTDDGEVIASFRMNPADIKLAKRLQEVGSFFEELGDNLPANATLEDAIKFNDSIEEKVCEILGYDARASLFGQISATSIMADGNMFVLHVLDTIQEHAFPEIDKRNKAMAAAVAKHTAKYE
jgi:hypothetical protein